jgi:hypothetical protein
VQALPPWVIPARHRTAFEVCGQDSQEGAMSGCLGQGPQGELASQSMYMHSYIIIIIIINPFNNKQQITAVLRLFQLSPLRTTICN